MRTNKPVQRTLVPMDQAHRAQVYSAQTGRLQRTAAQARRMRKADNRALGGKPAPVAPVSDDVWAGR